MEISEDLRCMFSAEVQARDDSYVIEVPKREVELQSVTEGEVYRVVLLAPKRESTGMDSPSAVDEDTPSQTLREPPADSHQDTETDAVDNGSTATEPTEEVSSRGPSVDEPAPPVDRGDELVVDIESIGDQGDGIARVDRGYVIIVPDTDKGERVRINVTSVKQNVAFAEVVDRLDRHIFE